MSSILSDSFSRTDFQFSKSCILKIATRDLSASVLRRSGDLKLITLTERFVFFSGVGSEKNLESLVLLLAFMWLRF